MTHKRTDYGMNANRSYVKVPYGTIQYRTYTDTSTGKKKTLKIENSAAPEGGKITKSFCSAATAGLAFSIGLWPVGILAGIAAIGHLLGKEE